MNENRNILQEIVWDIGKTVLGGKFMAVSDYVQREERFHIDTLIIHFTEKKKQNKRVNQTQSKQKEGNNEDQSGNQ